METWKTGLTRHTNQSRFRLENLKTEATKLFHGEIYAGCKVFSWLGCWSFFADRVRYFKDFFFQCQPKVQNWSWKTHSWVEQQVKSFETRLLLSFLVSFHVLGIFICCFQIEVLHLNSHFSFINFSFPRVEFKYQKCIRCRTDFFTSIIMYCRKFEIWKHCHIKIPTTLHYRFLQISNFYHPHMPVGNNFTQILVCVSSQAVTFELLELGTTFSVCSYT